MISNRSFLALGLVLALIVGVAAVFLASGDPDGLDSTALVVQGQKELTQPANPDAEVDESALPGEFECSAPFPDYTIEGATKMTDTVPVVVEPETIGQLLFLIGLVTGIVTAAGKFGISGKRQLLLALIVGALLFGGVWIWLSRVTSTVPRLSFALPADRSVARSFVPNELISNAFKHAFPASLDRTGSVTVRLTVNDDCIDQELRKIPFILMTLILGIERHGDKGCHDREADNTAFRTMGGDHSDPCIPVKTHSVQFFYNTNYLIP